MPLWRGIQYQVAKSERNPEEPALWAVMWNPSGWDAPSGFPLVTIGWLQKFAPGGISMNQTKPRWVGIPAPIEPGRRTTKPLAMGGATARDYLGGMPRAGSDRRGDVVEFLIGEWWKRNGASCPDPKCVGRIVGQVADAPELPIVWICSACRRQPRPYMGPKPL